eukprot:8705001-Pyramimonas_sp.AAC.1
MSVPSYFPTRSTSLHTPPNFAEGHRACRATPVGSWPLRGPHPEGRWHLLGRAGPSEGALICRGGATLRATYLRPPGPPGRGSPPL